MRILQDFKDAMSGQAQAERQRESFWDKQKQNLGQVRSSCVGLQRKPCGAALTCHEHAYEAIKERGSMVMVPSSAGEMMGLGGSLATAALAKGQR